MPRLRNNPTAGLAIKRHNIRIWCHECDMGRLQRVVWEGHGTRLLTEVSSQPVVKRFLEAVPYIMNTIRDVHNAVIQNDLEGLMRLTADPIPSQVFSSRDVNGMTALHKAAGLGHNGIVKYIIEKYPQGISDVDNDGRTPLHYAAIIRDEQHTYNTLVGLGADESVVDNKNKTPGYYINRPQEIDKNTLKILPDAPRTPSSAYPTSWDWKILDIEHLADFNKKSRKKNLKASNENISSKNNTSTLSETVESHPNAMKNSNTHELINTLPELDDTEKTDTQNSQNVADDTKNNEASEVVEEKDSHENTGDVINEQEEVSNNTLLNGSDNNQPTSVDIEEKQLKPEDKTEDKTLQCNDESTIENEKNELSDVGNLHEHENIPKSKTEDSNKEDNNDEKQEQQNEKADEFEKLIEHKIEEHNEEISVHANITDNESMKNGHETSYKTEQDENSEVHQNNSHETDSNDAEIEVKEQDTEINREDSNSTDMKNSQNTPNGEFKSENQESESDSKNSDLMQEEKGSDPVRGPEGKLTEGRNTQESLIEGLISSEPEQDSQDASITQKDGSVHGEILVVDNEIDPEVTELINSANMEMLATLVLNGEGSRLIGRRSQNVELQSFLENVPMYMEKINRVHIAAKEGNIRDLQTALDRRKFAIARDPISPNGATPLHVATVFGKTNIIKYLGGRFPETLSAVDFEGRTALHYAAVIPDNGHYFNLLQQLGANAKDLDDNGRSAEDYLHHPDLLPYEQLLNDYDISEDIAQNMLADKGKNNAVNGHIDIPVFHTEEGRYLAKSLGDPLIKGLTEVANVKPKDPVAYLATFLHNFPENEKPRLNTQESNVVVTSEAAEVDNDQPPPQNPEAPVPQRVRSAALTATRPRPIDVITLEPKPEVNPDAPEIAQSSSERDEHGQSMLHFAAARTHANNALFQLLQECDVSLGYRDELYRTARDVAIQANVPENTVEIDKWVLHLAARGKGDKIMELLLQGYDHILDIVDEGVNITEVVAQRGDTEMINLLASIPGFEESRESLHNAVRRGDLVIVRDIVSAEGGRAVARAHNAFGRTALHVAVLAQHEDVVAYLAETCPELLRIGDNLERTPLHYAMGVDKIESLSRVLIRAGAKRVLKDLKGRQPSYYFMNKSDILRLKEEEEAY
ncbi:uncharacterized protein LOC106710644 isoform X2 [Papilio machaon]|uniref:uncharacterized protein LOC106710644 isoform X2 n=1 Tax=Papilio machaon TaxID=76193 RepID=UPI001E6651A9|nr:uncharacterized protein LOC106710644 isoform X2 [Papilio machaon]